MTGNLRRTLALTMGLLLAIFTICQAHAMTDMPSSNMSFVVTVYQDSGMGDKHQAMPCCQDECQNQQAADLGKKPQLPDSQPLLVIATAYPAPPEAPVLKVSGHVADRAQGDPHPLLRFQRFLE